MNILVYVVLFLQHYTCVKLKFCSKAMTNYNEVVFNKLLFLTCVRLTADVDVYIYDVLMTYVSLTFYGDMSVFRKKIVGKKCIYVCYSQKMFPGLFAC